ncbi:glycosyltransferase 87 family protein [Williamsia sp. M5A3_1d]
MTAVVVAAFAVTALVRVVGMPLTHSFGDFARIDIDVYRLGAQLWRNGGSLYAAGSMPFTTDGIWLPFTYPPFAALSFLPFTVVPLVVAGAAIALVTVVATVAVSRIVVTRLRIGPAARRGTLALAVATAALWTNPYWMTLGFGQVNVVLMLLVAVDLLVLPKESRWRGTLIGVAAAIKLTPLAFVLFLIVRREWRATVRAIGVFVGLALLGLVWAPVDSVRYWGHTVFHTDRIGDLSGGINQSVNGFWIRVLGWSGPAEQVVWALSVVALTALAVVAVRHCDRLGGDVLAVSVVAVWAVMVSPTSWAHHWVWAVPAIIALSVVAARTDDRRVRRAYAALAGVGLLVMATGPFQFLPAHASRWSGVDVVAGNAYCLWGLAVLVTIVVVGQAAGSDRSPGMAGAAPSGAFFRLAA